MEEKSIASEGVLRPFTKFPDELLLRVFRNLSVKMLLTVARVSRRWLSLAREQPLWLRALYQYLGLSETTVPVFKTKLPALEGKVCSIIYDERERHDKMPLDFNLSERYDHVFKHVQLICREGAKELYDIFTDEDWDADYSYEITESTRQLILETMRPLQKLGLSDRVVNELLARSPGLLHVRDKLGHTVLHFFAVCQIPSLVSLCLARGADVHARTHEHDSVLRFLIVNCDPHVASEEELIETIKCLLSAGAFLNTTDLRAVADIISDNSFELSKNVIALLKKCDEASSKHFRSSNNVAATHAEEKVSLKVNPS